MAYAYEVLDALGDSTRRLVFERLRTRARSVGEIAERMEVSRPAVSQHLRVLKTARLVTDRAEGTRRLYAVDPRGIKALRSWLTADHCCACGSKPQTSTVSTYHAYIKDLDLIEQPLYHCFGGDTGTNHR
jgi:DNA-binding transcriptional ArsR family regulator